MPRQGRKISKSSVTVSPDILEEIHDARIVPGENLENVVRRGLVASRLLKVIESENREIVESAKRQLGVPA
jgi:hypothetical protein